MKLLSDIKKGSLYALTSGLLYGLIGYFGIMIMNAGISIYNMVFFRFLISTLSILPLAIFHYKTLFASPKENLKMFFYGLGLYAFSAIFYFISSKYLGTGLAMVISFTYPAFVVIFNVLYYRITFQKIYYIALPMMVIGMFMLVDSEGATFDLVGIFFGLLASFVYALYIIGSKTSKLHAIPSTFLVSLGCMSTSLILTIFDGSLIIPRGFEVWKNILGIGIICTSIPILLLLVSFKYISSESASILSVSEPIFVLIFGIILLNEKISMIEIMGATAILVAAFITLLPEKSKA